jgi:protein arginine kinase activator
LLRRVHGDVKHIGKVPVRSGPAYEEAARLRRLNEDLERAIQSEDYERAAEIRDLIQQLETSSVGDGAS